MPRPTLKLRPALKRPLPIWKRQTIVGTNPKHAAELGHKGRTWTAR